ncbi:hypothetical protein Tco_0771162 [Tanacetum coccineum]|uniref:Uncharacterized protein n=1 Tax=Tanacetum coccineum TaxID=301880 RepID=A0ABQ4ZG66_9ASTR
MEKLEDENVSLDFTVQYLIKERDNVKLEYQKLFNSIKKTRSQTQTEMDELIAHVTEKTYAYGAIRVENQNLLFNISELKTRLENAEKGMNDASSVRRPMNRDSHCNTPKMGRSGIRIRGILVLRLKTLALDDGPVFENRCEVPRQTEACLQNEVLKGMAKGIPFPLHHHAAKTLDSMHRSLVCSIRLISSLPSGKDRIGALQILLHNWNAASCLSALIKLDLLLSETWSLVLLRSLKSPS